MPETNAFLFKIDLSLAPKQWIVVYNSLDILVALGLLGGFTFFVWALFSCLSKHSLQRHAMNYLVSKLLRTGENFHSLYPPAKDCDSKIAVRLGAV